MPWERVYVEAGRGRSGHRAARVDVTEDELVVRWNARHLTRIPLERITWVSEHQEPCDPLLYRPSFVTVHYEDEDGAPASLTLTCWQCPSGLVAAIAAARADKLARSGALAASLH